MTTPLKRYEFRKLRTRRKIFGTSDRPRLSVYRSSRHIYAQLVDDGSGHTLAHVSTLGHKGTFVPEAESKDSPTTPQDAARKIGLWMAEKAKELNIQRVVFDRGGWPYHGRIKALAEGAREGGLKF